MPIIRKTAEHRLEKELAPSENVTPNILYFEQKLRQIKVKGAKLTNLLYPAESSGWDGIYKSGWEPWCFNEQWGGAHIQLPNGSFGDAATGYTNETGRFEIGNTVGATWYAQPFVLSQGMFVQALWVQLHKVGNPKKDSEPLVIGIASSLDNGSGVTWVTNGQANAINGHSMVSASENWPITPNPEGEWYRITFAVDPILSANTVYYLVQKATGQDASNYFIARGIIGVSKYPFGGIYKGNDATPTTWSKIDGDNNALTFLIEGDPSYQLLQRDGKFDGKLSFAPGTPVNQSKAVTQPMEKFFDRGEFTALYRSAGLSKNKTFMDFVWGIDHDRIVVRCNQTTGYVQVTLYETDGTKHTITGSHDVSSGNHDIGILARMQGDINDYLKIYVDGNEDASTVQQTFTMSNDFVELGTAWLGGGFPLSPAVWTGALTMSTLPSAGGWTWNGTASEGDCMFVAQGRLFQNMNGYGTIDTGYYKKTTPLSNGNGWVVTWKCQIRESGEGSESAVQIVDGAKTVKVKMSKFYVETADLARNAKYNIDLTDKEHVFVAMGKASSFYLFIDKKLVIDGENLLTTTSAFNFIQFGDMDSGGGKNADVVWDYIKYYTSWGIIEVSSSVLNEFAYWSGDQSGLLPIVWQDGIGVKDYCGVQSLSGTQSLDPQDLIGDWIDQLQNKDIYFVVPSEPIAVGSDQVGKITVGFSGIIVEAKAAVSSAPSGSDIIFDINKNGTTIWANQSNRVRIPAGSYSGTVRLFNDLIVQKGDYFTLDIDQVGSTVPGSKVVVVLTVKLLD